MSNVWPSALNNFPTGSSSPTLLAAGHTDLHNKLETKIGVDNSAVVTSLDYLLKSTSSIDPGHKHTLVSITDVTASVAEVNVLDGIPATLTATELGYMDGVTSAVQTQFNILTLSDALKAPIASPTFTGTVTMPVTLSGIAKLTTGVLSAVTAPTGTIVGTTDTQDLTNKTISTGSKLDANADENFTYYSMARQAIINGNFDVWQRGISVVMTTGNNYTADCWYCETATAGTDKTVSRQDGTGVNGSYYCARVAMVQDIDELIWLTQVLESQDSIKFRGKKLTLSFYARGGAEFVADNPTLVSKIVTGKGTDQKALAFTSSADAVNQNNTLTTEWEKFTCISNVIASDITQIGITFAFTHAGSGVTTNYFEITQVQLCAGDVDLPFQPKNYQNELKDCLKYFYAPENVGNASDGSLIGTIGGLSGANTAVITVPFPVKMKSIPILYGGTTMTNYEIAFDDGSVQNPATIPLSSFLSNSYQAVLLVTFVTGKTTGHIYLRFKDNSITTGDIGFTAEL